MSRSMLYCANLFRFLCGPHYCKRAIRLYDFTKAPVLLSYLLARIYWYSN